MFKVHEKFGVEAFWFCDSEVNYNHSAIYRDVLERDKNNFNLKKYKYDKNLTLITDLLSDIDDIKASFKKTVRYEINKATKLPIEVKVKNYVNEDEFSLLNKLYSSINLKEVSKNRILKYPVDNLIVTSIYDSGFLVCFHVYLSDDKRVRLLYSACVKGKVESLGVDASFINRYLHFKDIEMFKFQGKKLYDWGGITSYESPNGVDKFKMGFSGSVENTYTLYSGFIKIIKKIGVI